MKRTGQAREQRAASRIAHSAPREETARIPANHTAHTLLGTFAWLRAAPAGVVRRVLPDVWTAEPMDLARFRAWFARRLEEKINRSEPARGRKDCADWFRAASHTARRVNTPRLVVRAQEIPLEFRARLAHRLHTEQDW